MLICIDDVESIIEAELAAQTANATPPPTRLVGVPPSRGRGGNQTPRSESVFITGSQPLPSPSSSFGSTSHLDRWSFGMSKIEADGGPSGAGSPSGSVDVKEISRRADSTEQAAERMSGVNLNTSPFGEKTRPEKAKPPAGPSLLSQQALAKSTSSVPGEGGPVAGSSTQVYTEEPEGMADPPDGESAMSVDPAVPTLEGMEKITVKIADLGNGASL